MNWKEVETRGTEKNGNGIGTNYEFSKFKFINSQIGILSGLYNTQMDIDLDHCNHINISLNQDAIILRTKDSGYNWEEKKLGKGDIIDFVDVDNTLIALRESYHGAEAEEIVSHIHISKDQGENWQEIGSKADDTIDEIHFWTAKKGIGICGLKRDRYAKLKILFTDDGGNSWTEIKLPDSYINMDFTITKEGILYYLKQSRKEYYEFNLNTLEFKTHNLFGIAEKPFSVVMDNNENLYFVASDSKSRNIMYRKPKNENTFQKIEFPFEDLMINDVHIYDNVISIIIDANGGVCYRSEDFGKIWKEENLPNKYFRNIAFYGKDNIWIRTFPGKMLIRN